MIFPFNRNALLLVVSSLLLLFRSLVPFFFFFNDTATPEFSTLSLHDALPISLFAEHAPFGVWGAGSNVLTADGGIRGVVLKIGKGVDRVRRDGDRLIAESGGGLPHLARDEIGRAHV